MAQTSLKKKQPSEPRKRLLSLLEVLQEHLNLKKSLSSIHRKSHRLSEAHAQLLKKAEEVYQASPAPSPTKPRKKKEPAPDISMVIRTLREQGPMTRARLLEVLAPTLGEKTSMTLGSSVKRQKVFTIRVGRGKQATTYITLVKPAGSSVKKAFTVNWDHALRTFVRAYDSFTLEDAMLHVGVAPAYRRIIQDNQEIVEDILRGHGFKKDHNGRWIRRPVRPRIPASQADSSVLAALRSMRVAQLSEIADKLRAPRTVVASSLRRLVLAKQVQKAGERRGAIFFVGVGGVA